MITLLILIGFFIIFSGVGYYKIRKQNLKIVEKLEFVLDFRENFVEFSNKYATTGELDTNLYNFLILNLFKIENYLGSFGIVQYKPAFRNYVLTRYSIVTNTIPKFVENRIHNVDIQGVDDCLLRFIGYMNDKNEQIIEKIKNPFNWFIEGFREFFSIPIFLLSLFGILSSRTMYSIKQGKIFKIISGVFALVAFLSGIVTIIVGHKKSLDFIINVF